MESAGRSFTEPAGLLPSSLSRIVLVVLPGSRCKRTNGVLPTIDSIVGKSILISIPESRLPGGAKGGYSTAECAMVKPTKKQHDASLFSSVRVTGLVFS